VHLARRHAAPRAEPALEPRHEVVIVALLGRLRRNARRLVDHEQILVLVDDPFRTEIGPRIVQRVSPHSTVRRIASGLQAVLPWATQRRGVARWLQNPSSSRRSRRSGIIPRSTTVSASRAARTTQAPPPRT